MVPESVCTRQSGARVCLHQTEWCPGLPAPDRVVPGSACTRQSGARVQTKRGAVPGSACSRQSGGQCPGLPAPDRAGGVPGSDALEAVTLPLGERDGNQAMTGLHHH